MSYFLDTYAMIEIVCGNTKYKKYINERVFTTLYNLYEFYFVLLKDFNENVAEKYFYYFRKKTIDINDEHVFKAARFKLDNIKKRLSYVDCLGYIIAKDMNIKFLTGDKEFEGLDNVEFVKRG